MMYTNKYKNPLMNSDGGEVSSGDSLFLFLYLAKVPLHRLCETSRVSYRSFLLWISSLCLHLLAQIHNKNLR